ncbi:lipopolysaccharide core heptose(II) kinase RfaY [Fusobacterium perfoetens]|uniref:lipopolysaccharide core heptose(II) kinase RfaY n=1 Tax=Fusobacterium perfoetens TaxID=852 RepID=UPI0023F41BE1|nr:lipopolysaccharide core heptose(II) kinase RfaY [Fusobacterium perfoetens]MDY3237429.1 lipopolysaccharide core heptose(II) kinase RfaY [Fusobacterium perfoetens]
MYKGIMEKKKVFFNELSSIEFFDVIKEDRYKLLKTLKSDNRSIVKLIQFRGKPYIYKIPLEKNTRKWQRILSFFRGSEAQREFKNLEKILENGFNTSKPYFACEIKKFGMVIDSYIIMEYINGNAGDINSLPFITDTLSKIHKKGYIHGDSQLSNFILTNDKCYIIDAKFNKSIFGKIAQTYEFIYLETSCGQDIGQFYSKKGLTYLIARGIDNYLILWGRFRAWIKSLIRGERNISSSDTSKENFINKFKNKISTEKFSQNFSKVFKKKENQNENNENKNNDETKSNNQEELK